MVGAWDGAPAGKRGIMALGAPVTITPPAAPGDYFMVETSSGEVRRPVMS